MWWPATSTQCRCTPGGQAHGQTLEDHNVLVCHCSGGRITEVWEHHEDLYAVDAFWGRSGD